MTGRVTRLRTTGNRALGASDDDVRRAVPDVLRAGLGVVIFLAGIHKIAAPSAWSEYLAPVFAVRWPVSINRTMVVFGLSELPVGVFLVLDRYTVSAAAIVSVSMGATVGNLAITVLQTGRSGETLIRDLGILVLAIGVTIFELTDDSSRE